MPSLASSGRLGDPARGPADAVGVSPEDAGRWLPASSTEPESRASPSCVEVARDPFRTAGVRRPDTRPPVEDPPRRRGGAGRFSCEDPMPDRSRAEVESEVERAALDVVQLQKDVYELEQ